jgi:hypothetical protein
MKAIANCSLPDVYYSFLGDKPTPIEINDSNRKYIQEQFEQKDDRTWNELASELISIKRELRDLQQREQEIKNLLVGMCGHANSTGGGIQVQKIVKKGCIRYSLVQELQGVDLEQYRDQATEYWKVSEL